MKILHMITRSDTIGGAQKYVIDVACYQKEQGHDVTILSSPGGELKKIAVEHNIDYIEVKGLRRELNFISDMFVLVRVISLLRRRRGGVLFLHSVKAGLLGRLSTPFFKGRVYYIAHGWSHIRNAKKALKKAYMIIENVLSLLCDKVICVSETDRIYACEKINIRSDRLLTIKNGVKSSSRNMLKHKRDGSLLRLLSVTRFQEPKDCYTLFDGLRNLPKNSWTLDLLGDGPDILEAKKYIIENGLSDNIKFHGFISDVRRFYQDSDIVLLISKSEGLPISLIEAMSESKPLVASNVGGIPELIDEGNNGYLIDFSDSFRIEQVITTFIENPEILMRMGSFSYNLYLENYMFIDMVRKLDELLIPNTMVSEL